MAVAELLVILTKAGCNSIFQDKITLMSLQRPALDELLGLLREGDTVLFARFFRLGRSRHHVIHLVNSFHQRGIHFKALDLGLFILLAGLRCKAAPRHNAHIIMF